MFRRRRRTTDRAHSGGGGERPAWRAPPPPRSGDRRTRGRERGDLLVEGDRRQVRDVATHDGRHARAVWTGPDLHRTTAELKGGCEVRLPDVLATRAAHALRPVGFGEVRAAVKDDAAVPEGDGGAVGA